MFGDIFIRLLASVDDRMSGYSTEESKAAGVTEAMKLAERSIIRRLTDGKDLISKGRHHHIITEQGHKTLAMLQELKDKND